MSVPPGRHPRVFRGHPLPSAPASGSPATCLSSSGRSAWFTARKCHRALSRCHRPTALERPHHRTGAHAHAHACTHAHTRASPRGPNAPDGHAAHPRWWRICAWAPCPSPVCTALGSKTPGSPGRPRSPSGPWCAECPAAGLGERPGHSGRREKRRPWLMGRARPRPASSWTRHVPPLPSRVSEPRRRESQRQALNGASARVGPLPLRNGKGRKRQNCSLRKPRLSESFPIDRGSQDPYGRLWLKEAGRTAAITG